MNMLRSAVACLALVSFQTLRAASPPVPLFDCRVSVEPLLAKLKASGGDPARILHPHRTADLFKLASGTRYKFALTAEGDLAVAPDAADAPGNEYTHPVLAAGRPVQTAGGVRIDHDRARISRVTVDADSRAYCPTPDSLRSVLGALVEVGVAATDLRVDNRPCACADWNGAPSAPAAVLVPAKDGPRYGALMFEVGRRFETLGRALVAERWDLARFELDELREVFEEDLPHAEVPKESGSVDLKGLATAFLTTHPPELEKALKAHDVKGSRDAFARTATTCNACHKNSGHVFIEIPDRPGLPVPHIEPAPVAPATDAARRAPSR